MNTSPRPASPVFSSSDKREEVHPSGVGVIVPLYNSATTIGETLCSLQSQTLGGWRCFVVNDGSTDAGPRIVESFCKADKRFTLIHQANKGLAGARNTGIEAALAAGCEYLHFLDADDWMTPQGLEWLLGAAQETGASYGGYELCDEHGRSLARQHAISTPFAGLDEELDWNRTATHARLMHRHVLADDRFDETLPCVEDYDLWLRLEVRGVRFKAVERIVAAYRLRPTSMSKKFDRQCRVCVDVVSRVVESARIAASRGGLFQQDMDLSDRRLRSIVGSTVLAYATMEAMLDGATGKDSAVAIMNTAARPDRFTPAQCAQAACTAVLFGSCRGPDVDGVSERRWMPPLLDWWKRCAAEGWIGEDELDECMVELSRKVVHPDTVVAAMLDACPRGETARIGVVGVEKFGRRLCRRAAESGREVLIVDDFSEGAEAALLEPIDNVRICRDRGLLPKDVPSTWLVPPGIPAGTWMGLIGPSKPFPLAARKKTVLKWNDFRDRIAAAYLQRLHDAVEITEPSPARLMVG